MPTIKRKVEMNLGELLCWAIENKEKARFRDFSSKSMRVRFNDNAKPEIIFAKQFLLIEQIFTVEIEEEITEDTVIDNLIEINELIDFKKEGLLVGVSREVAKFEDIELLQTTGLTDYHYREYCGGDIARDVTSEEIGVVEYVEGAFVMRFAGGDSVYLSDVKGEFEIIGNKFEDGYLLEEG